MNRRRVSSLPSPHVGRLLARLADLDAPVVQLWAWPGCGAQEVLEALAAEPKAARLSASDLATATRLRRALAGWSPGGWLVAPALGERPTAVDHLAEHLPAGCRLAFASAVRRAPPALATAWLGPEEFLLTAGEIGTFWQRATGTRLSRAEVAELLAASEGWLRPLRLAASAGEPPQSVAALLAVPGVAEFLRREVWEAFSLVERAGLAAVAAAGRSLPASDDPWEDPGSSAETAAARAVAERGVAVGPPGHRRLPALLAAFAAAQGTVRRPRPVRRGAAAPSAASGASGQPVPPAFELRLLGAGGVRRPGEDGAIAWHLRRSFKVLAFLATSPGFEAGRDPLQEAVFWDVASAEEIRRNFHPTLSHLRRALEGARVDRLGAPRALVLHQGVYRLGSEVAWRIDAVDFEAGVTAGRAHAAAGRDEAAVAVWEASWRLYRGQFLAGDDDPWIHARREHYQRYYLELLGALGEALSRLGRLADATDALIASLLEDPLQERVALELMRVYARLGRRDLARRQFERLARDLRRELGVEPQREIANELSRLMGL